MTSGAPTPGASRPTWLADYAGVVLELLFPWRCLVCAQGALATPAQPPWERWLCVACAADLSGLGDDVCLRCGEPRGPGLGPAESCVECPKTPFIKRTYALFHYDGGARRLVHALKYERQRGLANPFGALLARAIGAEAPELIIPVPQHWTRALRRGDNQAALIAQALAHNLSRAWHSSALYRRRRTAPLFDLSPEARDAELKDAFSCSGPALKGRSVLLVDDVRTTGATLAACARTLHAAGAGRIAAALVCVSRRRL